MHKAQTIVSVIARIILLGIGFMIAAVSQFHGLDLNLGTISGVSLIVASLTPYSSLSLAHKTGGILVILISTVLYILISVEILFSGNSKGVSAMDASYFLPLVCLGYLSFIFLKSQNNNE